MSKRCGNTVSKQPQLLHTARDGCEMNRIDPENAPCAVEDLFPGLVETVQQRFRRLSGLNDPLLPKGGYKLD